MYNLEPFSWMNVLAGFVGCLIVLVFQLLLGNRKTQQQDKEPESLPPRYQGKYNNDPLLDATAAVGRQDMAYIIRSYWHWQNYTDPTTRGMITDRVDSFLVSKGIQVVEDEPLGDNT